MEQQTVKTSKRFLAFMIDMLLIGITIQLLLLILKTPIENTFHLEALMDEYYQIGQGMGIFDEARKQISQDANLIKSFNELTRIQEITSLYGKNQMIIIISSAFVTSTIFQFIIPLCVGQGRSIGKILTKLRVVKKDGSKINALTIFLRGFVGMTLIEYVISIPLGFIPFVISVMLVFVTKDKRAIHDYISGTKVAYIEGYEPKVYAEEKEQPKDAFHVSTKGFEYIDLEAIEAREKAAQERMDKESTKQESIENNKVIDLKEKVKNITLDDIEKKEKEALERMNNDKSNND